MLARVKLFGPMSRAVGHAELAVALADLSPTCAVLRASLLACEPAGRPLGRLPFRG